MQCEVPAINSTWQHYNGNVYKVVLITNMGSTRPEYPVTVVYITCSTVPGGRQVWVKPCRVGDASRGTVFHDYEVRV